MKGYYLPGDGVAVVASGLAVLLPAGDLGLARDVHAALATGAGSTQVLQTIARGGSLGFGEWPEFAVVVRLDDGVQVFVRGDLAVAVDARDGAVLVDGGEVTTWREQRVRSATRCTIGTAHAGDGDGLPIESGVVRASALVLAEAAADLAGGEPVGAAPAGEPASDPGPERLAAEAALDPPVAETASPELAPAPEQAPEPELAPTPDAADAEPEPEPAPTRGAAAAEAEPVDAEQVAPMSARAADGVALISDVPGLTVGSSTVSPYTSSTLAPEEPSRDALAPQAPEPAEETGYDHLWGATRMGRVEDAAVRPEEESEEGAGRPATAEAGDPIHDGMTIGPAALAELRRARAQAQPGQSGGASGAGSVPGSHGVLARVCLSGHSNPPERSDCWLCGRQVSGEATRRARPALGRMRLATGEVVELDGPYVVGRRPKVNRVQGEVPRVLAVPSPEGEVSASHLALRMEDWHVLAEDQSRNGTVLYREGEDPRRLQPHIPMIMRSGDVLDLGDGAQLTFEGLP